MTPEQILVIESGRPCCYDLGVFIAELRRQGVPDNKIIRAFRKVAAAPGLSRLGLT